MTPFLLTAFVLAAEPPPSADPKPVAATRDEIKQLLEDHKNARPRLPLPADAGKQGANNGGLRQHYLGDFQDAGWLVRGSDPAMTLDNTFRVKLFWIASRANNCYYCLGHQEHKLAGAGVKDDDIAALDGDLAAFTPAERAAMTFTKKFTHYPNQIDADDIATLTSRYTPTQALEIIVFVAGYNAMNRWTDGMNIPAEKNGPRFLVKDNTTHDFSTFKTPTSEKYAKQVTQVAPLAEKATSKSAPHLAARPPLESREQVEKMLAAAKTRSALLPVQPADKVSELWPAGNPPQWVRLLGTFPNSMKGRITSLPAAFEKGTLPAVVRAEIAWACAREDRAWYAVAVAKERLKKMGWTDDQIYALDGANDRPEAEKAAIAFARKLNNSPSKVTDMDVEALRKLYPDKAVAEIVYHVCNAAFFDRVTEAARLPLDP